MTHLAARKAGATLHRSARGVVRLEQGGALGGTSISMMVEDSAPFRHYLSVQWPIADLRGLVASELKLRRPTWPDSEPGDDFVRGFGAVLSRPRGPIHYWSGEASYCNAGRRIRLSVEPPMSHVNQVRLFGAEWCYRLDFGLTLKSESPHISDQSLNYILRTPVQVGHAQSTLSTGGTALSSLLSRATTPHNADSTSARRWLRPGQPMILLEEAGSASAEPTLRPSWVHVGRHRLPVYRSTHLPHSRDKDMRQVRGVIWRLHAEIETLRIIARQWKRDPSEFDLSELSRYLDHCADVMLPQRWGGVNQHLLMALGGGLDGSEISALLSQAQLESAGIRRRLDLLLERRRLAAEALKEMRQHEGEKIVIQYLMYNFGEGEQHVSGDTNISGDQYNNNAPLSGVFGPNAQVAGSSFQTQVGVSAEDLASLRATLEAIRARLPNETYEEIASSIDQIAAAPEADRPRRLDALLSRLKHFGETTQAILPLLASVGMMYPGAPGQ